MTYSKGTWDYDAESGEVTTDDRRGDWCVKDKRTLVCHVNPLDGASNGDLISASPDLLEALQEIVDEVDGDDRPESVESYLPARFVDAARKAIFKARGWK